MSWVGLGLGFDNNNKNDNTNNNKQTTLMGCDTIEINLLVHN